MVVAVAMVAAVATASKVAAVATAATAEPVRAEGVPEVVPLVRLAGREWEVARE